MENAYYLDDQALVVEQTLISLKNDETVFTVPSSFGGHPATVAGSGALSLKGVQELAFAPGYAVLKEMCLSVPPSLKRLLIPETVHTLSDQLFYPCFQESGARLEIDRALHPALWEDLRRNALNIGDNRRLVPSALLRREEMEPVLCLMRNAAQPAAEIRKEMRLLFFESRPANVRPGCDAGSIFELRPCYDFLDGCGEIEEYTAVMQMIREDAPAWRVPAAEEQSDLRIRYGQAKMPDVSSGTVSLAVYDGRPDLSGNDGRIRVRFSVVFDRVFFPAVRRIRHRGKDWWIYSRNHLTSRADCPYVREDMGVFDRDGLVTSRKTVEDVYAKFRFLCML